jgi:hypothetical protein
LPLQLLSGVAFAIKGTRALLGLPEPGVPRRAAFRLDPRPACDTAPTKEDDASESSDGASDSDDSQPRAAASIYIDIAASPLAKAKGELAPPSPGAPRLIEVEHIKVDAAQGERSSLTALSCGRRGF